jgi:hypothetical protein
VRTSLIPSDEETHQLGALARIDRSFGNLVNLMEATLFYRILGTPRQYIAKEHVIYFVRERGSDTKFQILPASSSVKPSGLPDSLDPDQLLGPAVDELRRLRRQVVRDVQALRELEAGVARIAAG